MQELIWQGILDEVYLVKVERTEPYKARVTIEQDNQLLVEQDFPLSYNAQFGPDWADIKMWQDWAIAEVEALEK